MTRWVLAAMAMLVGAGCGDSRCAMEGKPGLCAALIDGYHFRPKIGQCEQFDWGGCDGVRPFKTLAECELACE